MGNGMSRRNQPSTATRRGALGVTIALGALMLFIGGLGCGAAGENGPTQEVASTVSSSSSTFPAATDQTGLGSELYRIHVGERYGFIDVDALHLQPSGEVAGTNQLEDCVDHWCRCPNHLVVCRLGVGSTCEGWHRNQDSMEQLRIGCVRGQPPCVPRAPILTSGPPDYTRLSGAHRRGRGL